MKDKMTNGTATWITYRNPAGNAPSEKKNPWETALTKDDQFAPIVDKCGLPLFRRTFNVQGCTKAVIRITALGIFDLYCNGKRVGRPGANGATVYDELKPGWSDYRKRVLYYTYDLSDYLTDGENVLLAAVAPGWWNGRISLNTYGENEIALLASLSIVDAQGERNLVTNTDWQAFWGGRVRAADIWDGELYDANFPCYGEISKPGFDTSDWGKPIAVEHDIEITPHIGPSVMVRKGLERKPVLATLFEGTKDNGSDFGEINEIARPTGACAVKAGQTLLFDLGQNMVGWPAISVKGTKNTTVKIRVGEMCNDSGLKSRGNDGPKGSIYSINYRSAKAKAFYVLNGKEGGEDYCPRFTFFGFRYVEISASDDIEVLDFHAIVVGSATTETGRMETSSALVNRLISNVIWGQRGNYLSVPTDCPQRDERLGWTGDTQIFCNTAAYNANVDGFFRKWLQDARDSQSDTGMYPDVIPRSRVVGDGGAAWADAGIVVPYVMWKMYDDTDLVREHYDSMVKYMNYLATTGTHGPVATYGDWLAYEPTDAHYISRVYYVLDAQMMAKMAEVIGKAEDVAAYQALEQKLKDAFRADCCDENGALKPEFRTQTGYLLALKAKLLAPDQELLAVRALEKKIQENGYRLSTGFVGSGILTETLAEHGLNNLAYSLLLQRENPSWLYSVDQGATTIWERWNSYTLATGFGDVGMNSFNHYAYGAVQEWMYRHVAGIEVDENAPGFARVILQPKPDTRTDAEMPAGQERIKWVRCHFDSPHGRIVSNWSTENGFVYEAETPVPATLYLPVLTEGDTVEINGVSHKLDEYRKCPHGNVLTLTLTPGKYTFKM